jgi:serine/threonine protein kinase
MNTNTSALRQGYQLAEYTLERQLAEGGFSIVYLARDEQGKKHVIKEYFPHELVKRYAEKQVVLLDPKHENIYQMGLQLFFEEGRILRTINHPSVVSVSNFFRANKTVYMVMEYSIGETLETYLRKAPKHAIPEADLRVLFAQLAAGLGAIHKKNIVHLDLKPSNIYLREKGGGMLFDFGGSRFTSELHTKGKTFTPGFSAPEQTDRQGNVGVWTDIYAFGATLHVSMGAGIPPSALMRIKKETKGHLPSADLKLAKKIGHLYSPELITLVERCLSIDISARPINIKEIKILLSGRYSPSKVAGSKSFLNESIQKIKDLFSKDKIK